MLYIDNPCTDIYFNLAAEEYLLKHFDENILMLWQSTPTVVIGKHQDAFAEVNIDYTTRNNINIARRYSGGGAVFHDLGNLNITFIETVAQANFDKYTAVMTNILSELGLRTETDERRAIFLSGQKISGSAQCIYKHRALFHLTLLFSSNLEMLTESLNASDRYNVPLRRQTAVRSVKSPVDNIQHHLSAYMGLEEFRNRITTLLITQATDSEPYTWTAGDIKTINAMKVDKYATESWNMKLPASKDLNKANN